MKNIGVILVIAGCVTAAVGVVLLVAPKIPWLGNLPGDINYKGRTTSFHFPIVTCILISIVLTIILNLVMKFLRK